MTCKLLDIYSTFVLLELTPPCRDNHEDIVTIPGLAGGAVGTKYDWNLTYVETEFVSGRNINIPLGKVVGGSTKLNIMVFDRGSKSDYDRWAELGNKGWDWNGLFPSFKKVRMSCRSLRNKVKLIR